MSSGNGNNWYAKLAMLLILAIVGWCVIVVATGSQKVQATTTKIAVHDAVITRMAKDIDEIKRGVSALLGRR